MVEEVYEYSNFYYCVLYDTGESKIVLKDDAEVVQFLKTHNVKRYER